MLRAVAALVGGVFGTTNNPAAFTWAAKPSATGRTGLMIRITDVGAGQLGTGGGTLWMSNGTRWKLSNNQGVIDSIDTENASAGNTTEQNLNPNHNLIPGGVIGLYDRFYVEFTPSKSGTTSNCTLRLRFGSAGTVADTVIATISDLAATNQTGGYRLGFKRTSATTIQRLGNNNAANSYSGATTGAFGADITVPNLDSVGQYLSITSQIDAGTEIVTIKDYTLTLASTDS